MTEREERVLKRKQKATLKTTPLHSAVHHSFHLELNDTQSWNLLYTMSIKQWEEENGTIAPRKVDKKTIRIISLKDK